MILDLKPLDSIGEEDLNQLVSEGVIEAKTIEYKRDNYGSSDESKKEFTSQTVDQPTLLVVAAYKILIKLHSNYYKFL